MARLPRLCLPGIPLHIIQRGTNRQACFAADEDFAAYAYWLEGSARKYEVAIHAWVFMTNHVHLLATPSTSTGVSKMMQALGRHYVRYFNYTYQRTGTLWEGRFKSCAINEEEYLLVCQRYIELNPVRAGMVSNPEDYGWSSYSANGLGVTAKMWSPHECYTALGSTPQIRSQTYRELFVSGLEKKVVSQIQKASNTGMALGNDKFKREIEALAGRRVSALKRGPKSKKD
jgi:putative transposase